MPVIVYIIGVGHSGSTLLDLLLGSHSLTFSVGELIALSSTGKPGRHERILAEPCDCGAPSKSACAFWGEVDRRLQRDHATSLREIDLEVADPAAFQTANRAIYSAVAEQSGRSYVIESSKRATRFERLVEAGFDVRPIHILREPHGVIASNLRKGHDWRDQCRSYSRKALRTRRLLADRDHMRIRYEALATRPEETIRAVMEWLGLEFEPEQMRWSRTVHHHLAGNRMRLTGDDAIRFDQRWKTDLTAGQRWLISLCTLPARLRVRGSGRLGGPR
jgi:hypothetical protein